MVKKQVFLGIFLLLLIIYLCFVGKTYNNSRKTASNPRPVCLRLSIIANSKSVKDETIKIVVKNFLLVEMCLPMNTVDNFDNALDYAQEHIEELEEDLVRYLMDAGYIQTVKGLVIQEKYPAARYKNIKFPGDMYWTVRIIIGEGKGDEWWGILYPPLSFSEINHKSEALPVQNNGVFLRGGYHIYETR